PSGTMAAPVIRMAGPPQLIATDPERLAAVGDWRPELAGGKTLAQALSGVRGPDTPRVWLKGERFRVKVSNDLPPKGWTIRLTALLLLPDRRSPTLIPLGELRGRSGTHAWSLPPACRESPCE